MELGLWSPVVSEIPDFLSCIPDSKDQNSGLRQQKFSGFQNSDSLTCGKPFAKILHCTLLGLKYFCNCMFAAAQTTNTTAARTVSLSILGYCFKKNNNNNNSNEPAFTTAIKFAVLCHTVWPCENSAAL